MTNATTLIATFRELLKKEAAAMKNMDAETLQQLIPEKNHLIEALENLSQASLQDIPREEILQLYREHQRNAQLNLGLLTHCRSWLHTLFQQPKEDAQTYDASGNL